jgi:hypothetical protein
MTSWLTAFLQFSGSHRANVFLKTEQMHVFKMGKRKKREMILTEESIWQRRQCELGGSCRLFLRKSTGPRRCTCPHVPTVADLPDLPDWLPAATRPGCSVASSWPHAQYELDDTGNFARRTCKCPLQNSWLSQSILRPIRRGSLVVSVRHLERWLHLQCLLQSVVPCQVAELQVDQVVLHLVFDPCLLPQLHTMHPMGLVLQTKIFLIVFECFCFKFLLIFKCSSEVVLPHEKNRIRTDFLESNSTAE